MLLCPVCHEPLVDDERGAACAGGHRFDRAREGYLYLLRSSKSGDSMVGCAEDSSDDSAYL